jgi:hypothetical protein
VRPGTIPVTDGNNTANTPTTILFYPTSHIHQARSDFSRHKETAPFATNDPKKQAPEQNKTKHTVFFQATLLIKKVVLF